MKRYQIITNLLVVVFVLVGCASKPFPSTSTAEPAQEQATIKTLGKSIPLPEDARIDSKASLVLGDGEAWVGRAEIHLSESPNDAIQYFLSSFPAQGWQVISSNKARNSILVFINQTRSATLEITEGTIFTRGSKVIMTLSPRK